MTWTKGKRYEVGDRVSSQVHEFVPRRDRRGRFARGRRRKVLVGARQYVCVSGGRTKRRRR